MHIGEALCTREEAIALAKTALLSAMDRNAPYYLKMPGHTPRPEAPTTGPFNALDTWILVTFARTDPALKPISVRVNGVTKKASIDGNF